MNKQELTQFHRLLLMIKNELIKDGYDESNFEEYNKLEIKPQHLMKTKEKHEKAVLTLANELDDIFDEGDEPSELSEVKNKLEKENQNF